MSEMQPFGLVGTRQSPGRWSVGCSNSTRPMVAAARKPPLWALTRCEG